VRSRALQVAEQRDRTAAASAASRTCRDLPVRFMVAVREVHGGPRHAGEIIVRSTCGAALDGRGADGCECGALGSSALTVTLHARPRSCSRVMTRRASSSALDTARPFRARGALKSIRRRDGDHVAGLRGRIGDALDGVVGRMTFAREQTLNALDGLLRVRSRRRWWPSKTTVTSAPACMPKTESALSTCHAQLRVTHRQKPFELRQAMITLLAVDDHPFLQCPATEGCRFAASTGEPRKGGARRSAHLWVPARGRGAATQCRAP